MGLWALAALESQRGERVHAFNFGNLAAVPQAATCTHPTAVEDGSRVRLRAFASPTEGASALWAALGDPTGPIFRALDEGRWPDVAATLTARRYHRADPQRYGQAIPRLAEDATTFLLPRLRSELAQRTLPEVARTGRVARAYSRLPLDVFVTSVDREGGELL
jgi:hypothetical protein